MHRVKSRYGLPSCPVPLVQWPLRDSATRRFEVLESVLLRSCWRPSRSSELAGSYAMSLISLPDTLRYIEHNGYAQTTLITSTNVTQTIYQVLAPSIVENATRQNPSSRRPSALLFVALSLFPLNAHAPHTTVRLIGKHLLS